MDYLFAEIACTDTLDEEQEREDRKDAEKLAKDTETIKTIMKDLNELIEDEDEQIVFAERITDETHDVLKETNENIHKARESQKKALILKGTLISAGVGLCVGGPIGGLLGSSVHLTTIGAIIGGVSFGGFMGSLTNYVLSTK